MSVDVNNSSKSAYDVFVSYRRENGAAEARLIRSALEQRALRVFLDVADLGRGHFDDTLLKTITATPGFVLILSRSSLERCSEEGDWLRREITQAIRSKRNVIPVILPGFAFPADLPEEIADLSRFQGVEYSHLYFDAAIQKLLELLGATPGKLKNTPSISFRIASGLKRHPLVLVLALLAVVASVPIYQHLNASRQKKIIQIADNLLTQFHSARDAAVAHNFAAARKFLDASDNNIRQLTAFDANNGHALYFSGEIKRLRAGLQSPALFDTDRCPLSQASGDLTSYEADFVEYLEHWSEMPAQEKGADDKQGNYASVCYDRASGYCWQRTRWVEHLLANDLYVEALRNNDPTLLDRASVYAADALKYRDATTKRAGFYQCTDTTKLLAEIRSAKEKLNAIGRK